MKCSRKCTVNVAVLTCAALLLVSFTPVPASAAPLPTLGTRLYYMLGSFLKGGMVSVGAVSTDTTSVAGAWEVLPEFASATTLKPVTNAISSGYAHKGDFTAYVRGTGSTTLRYGAACFPN